MIYYKTISADPNINTSILVNEVIFTLTPSIDPDYPIKVIVDNENQYIVDKLSETEGLIILSEEEYNLI